MTSKPHLLMTTDAVGGVWTYTRALAGILAKNGWNLTIVTLGPAPHPDELAALQAHPRITVEVTSFALEWQDPAGDDRAWALDHLARLEKRVRPDVVHINGYRDALAGWRAPVVVVAHSCVGTWWQACRSGKPDAEWRSYLADVAAGLAAADRWVAPTIAFRDEIARTYAPATPGAVIWNGAPPRPPGADAAKEELILGAGRLWDEAKNINILNEINGDLDWPICVAGERSRERSDKLEWLGKLSHADLAAVMKRAGIFVSPAVYEPFGLTVLEAASAGCALVLADIPTFRELWDGAALFVPPRDPRAIRAALQTLSRNAHRRADLQAAARQRALRYSLAVQTAAYEQLYLGLLSPHAGAETRAAPTLTAEVSA